MYTLVVLADVLVPMGICYSAHTDISVQLKTFLKCASQNTTYMIYSVRASFT